MLSNDDPEAQKAGSICRLNKSKSGVPLRNAIRIPKAAMPKPTTNNHLCQKKNFCMMHLLE
jgi:hypothetical protein